MLPLLKREAFESALYTLCEMGATSIQPLITQKSRTNWDSEKDFARVLTTMRAAAGTKIFFDPAGMPLKQMLSLPMTGPLYGCVGPEGGLTPEEKEHLKALGFVFCRLTPTVLRARQAVAVGLGILRSYCSS